MFAERFGAVERRLASFGAGPARVSDELYVLGLTSEASVKVRDGVMDVKRLVQVDAEETSIDIATLRAELERHLASAPPAWDPY